MRTLIIAVCTFAFASSAQAQYRNESLVSLASRPAESSFSIPGTSPLLRFLSPDCDLDRTRGREAASNTHSGSGWMLGGVASGVVLGLIGTAIITAVASSSASQAERVPDDAEPSCFRDGYSSRAKSMNTTSALTGGLLGTAVLLLIILSANSGSSY
jgi:hypothetical protein